MTRPLSLATLAILPLLVSACCSKAQPRFWEVRDTTRKGSKAYTVDTAGVPANTLQPRDIRYVDSAGHYTEISSPKPVRQLSAQEWHQATSGATYSLWYCAHRHSCWAKTKQR